MHCKVYPLIFTETEEVNCDTLCKVFSPGKKKKKKSNEQFLCSMKRRIFLTYDKLISCAP